MSAPLLGGAGGGSGLVLSPLPFPKAFDQLPRWLRAKRFSQEPAALDSLRKQHSLNSTSVIIQRPRRRARVSKFHKPRSPGNCSAEAAHQCPIAVHAGQI